MKKLQSSTTTVRRDTQFTPSKPAEKTTQSANDLVSRVPLKSFGFISQSSTTSSGFSNPPADNFVNQAPLKSFGSTGEPLEAPPGFSESISRNQVKNPHSTSSNEQGETQPTANTAKKLRSPPTFDEMRDSNNRDKPLNQCSSIPMNTSHVTQPPDYQEFQANAVPTTYPANSPMNPVPQSGMPFVSQAIPPTIPQVIQTPFPPARPPTIPQVIPTPVSQAIPPIIPQVIPTPFPQARPPTIPQARPVPTFPSFSGYPVSPNNSRSGMKLINRMPSRSHACNSLSMSVI